MCVTCCEYLFLLNSLKLFFTLIKSYKIHIEIIVPWLLCFSWNKNDTHSFQIHTLSDVLTCYWPKQNEYNETMTLQHTRFSYISKMQYTQQISFWDSKIIIAPNTVFAFPSIHISSSLFSQSVSRKTSKTRHCLVQTWAIVFLVSGAFRERNLEKSLESGDAEAGETHWEVDAVILPKGVIYNKDCMCAGIWSSRDHWWSLWWSFL